jgi:hypothetical protein
MKKEIDSLISCKDKKAQITIFIIIGVMILFISLAVIYFAAEFQKEQLGQEAESAFSKALRKEGMRIYVEKCLSDYLEEGLIILGKQGKIWDDQTGGRTSFIEGENGITYLPTNDRIFFGLIDKNYLEHNNAYPCSEETNFPEFCMFKHPDNTVSFGDLKLRSRSVVSGDISRYLEEKVMECLENFTKEEISDKIRIEIGEKELNVDILDDGINVKAKYPIRFLLGNDDFFHLSQFDFFYPTKFGEFLDVAIINPLQWDRKYLDFDYSEETLKQDRFEYQYHKIIPSADQNNPVCEENEEKIYCKQQTSSENYNGLSIKMDSEELDNGNDLFIFKSPYPNIVSVPGEYTFRFVRENRAPALDYVERFACTEAEYDYLVVKNEENLNEIKIDAVALDPDEDRVQSYKFESDTLNPTSSNLHTGEFYINSETVNTLISKTYNLKVIATDEHDKEDYQEVRILVEEPLVTELKLDIPDYQFVVGGEIKTYRELFESRGAYIVSAEDPVLVSIIFPDRIEEVRSSDVYMRYTDQQGTILEDFDYALPDTDLVDGTEGCFSFPGLLSENCETEGISVYSNYLGEWDQLQDEDFGHFKELTNNGLLSVTSKVNYCVENFIKEDSSSAPISVKECLPNYNPQRPFAYPYNNYIYNEESEIWDIDMSEEFNPLLATHSCCEGTATSTFGFRGTEDLCFENPFPKCTGELEGITDKENYKPGYVIFQEVDYCSGSRGNVCGDGDRVGEWKLWDNTLKCGSNENGLFYRGCKKLLPLPCQDKIPFSYIDTADGTIWCNGEMGCQHPCDEEVVLDDTNGERSKKPSQKALELFRAGTPAFSNEELGYHCGCQGDDGGNACDADLNGFFEGICKKDSSNNFYCD